MAPATPGLLNSRDNLDLKQALVSYLDISHFNVMYMVLPRKRMRQKCNTLNTIRIKNLVTITTNFLKDSKL